MISYRLRTLPLDLTDKVPPTHVIHVEGAIFSSRRYVHARRYRVTRLDFYASGDIFLTGIRITRSGVPFKNKATVTRVVRRRSTATVCDVENSEIARIVTDAVRVVFFDRILIMDWLYERRNESGSG